MPKRPDIFPILAIACGPLMIGQSPAFDHAQTRAINVPKGL